MEKYKNSKHQHVLVSSFSLLTDEINYLVDKHKMDLIIMGTKGASGLAEVVFGSNTVHTIKKAKCPILAIPDGFFFEKPKDILFPTDYKIDFTDNHVAMLRTIASLYSSTIHTIHVSSSRPLNETEQHNKDTLEAKLKKVNNVFYNLKEQSIPQAITEFQKSTYVHLLMMVKNKHTFLENLFFKKVIHQIGFNLTIPFLVIPDSF